MFLNVELHNVTSFSIALLTDRGDGVDYFFLAICSTTHAIPMQTATTMRAMSMFPSFLCLMGGMSFCHAHLGFS